MPPRIKIYLTICLLTAILIAILLAIFPKYYQWYYNMGKKHWWAYNCLNILYGKPPSNIQIFKMAIIWFIIGFIIVWFNLFGLGDKLERDANKKHNIHIVGVKKKGKSNINKKTNSISGQKSTTHTPVSKNSHRF